MKQGSISHTGLLTEGWLACRAGSRASVEQSINDLQASLSLARSRLAIRANKSGVEVLRVRRVAAC